MDQLASLRFALDKVEAKVQRLFAQADAATRERDEIETAIRVIERFSNQAGKPVSGGGASDNGQLIYGFVGVGPERALPPKDIIEKLRAGGHDLGDDLVRTQLWRMAKRGELENNEGRYWRPVTENADVDDIDSLDKGEAPNADRAGASSRVGRVAELEGPGKTEQHPFRNGENVGSSPTPPASVVEEVPSRGWDDFDDDVPF